MIGKDHNLAQGHQLLSYTYLSICSVAICVDLLWSNSKCVFMGMYFYICMYLVIQECIQGYQITLFWVFNSCSRDSQEPRPSCSRLGLQSGTGEPEPSLLFSNYLLLVVDLLWSEQFSSSLSALGQSKRIFLLPFWRLLVSIVKFSGF